MFSSEQSYSGFDDLMYKESQDSVLQTCLMVVAYLKLESYPTDGRTHG